jgi:amylosucrase
MDWEAAERRHVEGTVEHRVWHGLRQAVSVRSGLPSMDASVESEVMDPVNPAVLVLQRRASTQTMVGLYNMTPDVQKLPRWVVSLGNWSRDALSDEAPLTDGEIVLQPYQARWLVQSA